MWSFTVFLGLGMLFGLPDLTNGITARCLKCICDVESGCRENIHCGDGGQSCGPYQIKEVYWIDGGRLGGGYRACVNRKGCSEETIRRYMNRYATASRLGRNPTCEDYARIHNGGPNGYKQSFTNWYWGRIQSKGCSRHS